MTVVCCGIGSRRMSDAAPAPAPSGELTLAQRKAARLQALLNKAGAAPASASAGGSMDSTASGSMVISVASAAPAPAPAPGAAPPPAINPGLPVTITPATTAPGTPLSTSAVAVASTAPPAGSSNSERLAALAKRKEARLKELMKKFGADSPATGAGGDKPAGSNLLSALNLAPSITIDGSVVVGLAATNSGSITPSGGPLGGSARGVPLARVASSLTSGRSSPNPPLTPNGGGGGGAAAAAIALFGASGAAFTAISEPEKEEDLLDGLDGDLKFFEAAKRGDANTVSRYLVKGIDPEIVDKVCRFSSYRKCARSVQQTDSLCLFCWFADAERFECADVGESLRTRRGRSSYAEGETGFRD